MRWAIEESSHGLERDLHSDWSPEQPLRPTLQAIKCQMKANFGEASECKTIHRASTDGNERAREDCYAGRRNDGAESSSSHNCRAVTQGSTDSPRRTSSTMSASSDNVACISSSTRSAS